MKRDAYHDAGVDIDAADELVDRIGPLAASTFREGVIGGIGGFGGLFGLKGWRDPVLVSGTDGVGTKLLVAQRLGVHDTIGIDLVAMCVNDIACSGAEPLFFLDYLATGALEVDVAEQVVRGVAEGCRQAGCALLGGETAEMPGMYGPGHYDLAGFAVGAVERDRLLDGRDVVAGDALVAVPSSGLHSNGYSLVRRLTDDLDPDAEHGLGQPLAEALLAPTRIYARALLEAREAIPFKAVSHVTGGGIPGNVPRMLPAGLGAVLRPWDRPPIFDLLQRLGGLEEDEMLRTFNCGLGLVIAVAPEHADAVARKMGGFLAGEVVADADQRAVVG